MKERRLEFSVFHLPNGEALVTVRGPEGAKGGVFQAADLSNFLEQSKTAANASLLTAADWEGQLLELGQLLCQYGNGENQVFSGMDHGPGLLYLDFENAGDSCFDHWKNLEGIAWEAVADVDGFLLGRRWAVVRVYGGQELAPVSLETNPFNMLVIYCAPHGTAEAQQIRLNGEAALQGILEGWKDRVCWPDPREIKGPDTKGQLQGLITERQRFDAVHVIAHGDRGARRILLEGTATGNRSSGGAAWMDYREFANLLGDLFQAADYTPPLITLNVCSSSPLALELQRRLGGQTRVVGLLHEGREEDFVQFFGNFYKALFARAAARETDPMTHVEDAFLETVRQARDDASRQWFLPTLYTPRKRTPFLDFSGDPDQEFEETLKYAFDNWGDSAKVRESLKRLEEMEKDLRPHVSAAARELRPKVEHLRDCHQTIEELRAAISPGTNWESLYEEWKGRGFKARAAGVSFADIEQELSGVRLLAEQLHAFHEALDCGVQAIAALAEVQRGMADRLQHALENLERLFAKSRRPAEVLQSEVEALLDRLEQEPVAEEDALRIAESIEQALRSLDRGTASRSTQRLGNLRDRNWEKLRLLEELSTRLAGVEKREFANLSGVESALAECVECRRLLAEKFGSPAQGHRAADVEARLWVVVRQARSYLMAVDRPQGPDPSLTEPGRRLDLCLWLAARNRGEDPASATSAPLLPEDPEALLKFCRELQPAQGANSEIPLLELAARCPTFLANEGVPLRLAANLEGPLHPYAVLHRYGVSFSSSTKDVIDKASWPAEGDLEDLMHQAVNQLRDAQRRLLVDVVLLPFDEQHPEALNQALAACAEDLFAGRQPDPGDFPELSPMDQASLRAALGQTDAAATRAWDRALGDPANGEALRHAFLICCYHAEVLGPNSPQFTTAMRKVFALHGLLVRTPRFLAEWLRKRFAVYHELLPQQKEMDNLVSSLGQPLEKLVDCLLAAHPSREESRRLRLEWDAEVKGAKLAAEYPQLPAPGGYWAVGLQGHLPEYGVFLRNVYQRVSELEGEEQLSYFQAVRMSAPVLQQLIWLFSEFRLLLCSPTEEALAELDQLLPRESRVFSGDFGEPIEELLRARDFRTRFPMQAAMAEHERPAFMAGTCAGLALDKTLVRLRESLDGLNCPRAGTVAALLESMATLLTYMRDVEYALAAPSHGVYDQACEYFTIWLNAMVGEMEKEGDEKPPAFLDGTLSICRRVVSFAQMKNKAKAALGLQKVLAQAYTSAAVCASRQPTNNLEPALQYTLKAIALDRSDRRVVRNYLVAAVKVARHAKEERDMGRARSQAADTLEKARQFDAGLLEEQELKEIVQELELIRSNSDNPPPSPPPLGSGWGDPDRI